MPGLIIIFNLLWYGDNLNKKYTFNQSYNKHRFSNFKNFFYKYGFSKKYLKIRYNKYLYNIYIPLGWNFFTVKNYKNKICNLLFISKLYFIRVPLPPSVLKLVFFDYNLSTVVIHFNYAYNYLFLFLFYLSLLFNNLFKFFFIKLRFRGKGYYIYKSFRNTIAPQFNYSHRLYIYSYFYFIKFLSKTELIVFGTNYNFIKCAPKLLISYRPVNIFTGRGIRFSKQIIYKKAGKISTYR